MARKLLDAGFIDVLPLKGGLDAWRDAGHTVAALRMPLGDEGHARGESAPSTV
jgi:hypothetical protein